MPLILKSKTFKINWCDFLKKKKKKCPQFLEGNCGHFTTDSILNEKVFNHINQFLELSTFW